MSINWVMATPGAAEAFVKLPSEQILYKSPPRTTFDLSTSNSYPGHQPWSVKSEAGIVYVTNQRIVYLPSSPSPALQNFSCPILNMQDSYVRAPFFGANYWTSAVRPVNGGGIPAHIPVIEMKMIFRDGGAFDFHTKFEQIKERLYNAVQLAREEGRAPRAGGNLAGVNMANVHLDELPAYEPNGATIHPATQSSRDSTMLSAHVDEVEAESQGTVQQTGVSAPPNEPPPGYEEAQAQAVGIDFEGRLREEAGRQ